MNVLYRLFGITPSRRRTKSLLNVAVSLGPHANLLYRLFGIEPSRRWTESLPNAPLEALIAAGEEHYLCILADLARYAPDMAGIPFDAKSDADVLQWNNPWMTGLDAVLLYCFVRHYQPQTYLEIGSGYSTMFVRRAISDAAIGTKLISIDPQPRAGIDGLCDSVIRSPLESTDWPALVATLVPGDIIFVDSGHRCFQNSDVTVFFTEILPALPVGILIGLHDILLPCDYPEEWLHRLYSEQYLLACWLLADRSSHLRIELPVHWLSHAARLHEALKPLWQQSPESTPNRSGGSTFWFSKYS